MERCMEKFINWWKTDDRYVSLLKATLMALLPILCCLVYCGMQGKSIGDVYLPASEWNDELFYFKQVEGIIHYGFPQGYFGFNESHALKLSFAAWSPVLVFPWILWGLLFGWSLLSPIVCNIVLLTLAVFLFVWLVKPTWKQLGILAVMFCLYTPFVRYMLSGMPEIICFSMLILFYGLAINDLRAEKTYKLVLLFLMAGTMTLMRPYLVLFLLLPMYLWIRKSKWKGAIGSLAVVAVVGVCYVMIKHYLGAEYFAPLFFTEWVTTFFTKGIGAGIHNFLGTLYYMGKAFLGHMAEGFRNGLASGAHFGAYTIMMLILLYQSMADYKRYRRLTAQTEPADSVGGGEKTAKELSDGKAVLTVEVHLALCFVGMLFALLLMYKLTEGSKHLLTFMAAGIFVISLMRTKYLKKAALMGITFAYLYSYMAVSAYDYQVPFREETLEAQVEHWSEVYEGNLPVVGNSKTVPNYDNVVIWVLNDAVGEEETVVYTKWQLLYGLPKGFGISCCQTDYVIEHLSSLQSKYLVAPAGGSVDTSCKEFGYREIDRDLDLVLYQLR